MMFAVALLAVEQENRGGVSGARVFFAFRASVRVSACPTFVFELVCRFGSLVLQVLHHVVDFGLVSQEERTDEPVVNQDGSI